MPRPSNRERLLTAAADHVREHGAVALTLDAVAAAAGVSKGGLLYHFPTKAGLVAALIDDVLDRFEAEIDTRAGADPTPGAWARAYVDATFDTHTSQPDVAAALVATPEADGGVLERCVGRFEAWHSRLTEDGLGPGTAAVVRYACDGWWTYAGLTDRAPARTAALRERLHELIILDTQAPR